MATGVKNLSDMVGYESPILAHWLVCPFKASFCGNSVVQNSTTCLWHPSSDHPVYLIWKNADCCFVINHSDVRDDHEFFLTSSQKKSIQAGGDFLNSSFSRHVQRDILSQRAAETLGLQETGSSAEGTPRPQETEDNSAGRTQGPQEKVNNAGETRELQEQAEETQGLHVGSKEKEVLRLSQVLAGTVSPLGLRSPCSDSSFHVAAMELRKPIKVCELFSPPRICAAATELPDSFTTTEPPSFDRVSGWHFENHQHRQEFWKVVKEQKPDVIGMTPLCRPFSVIMNSNWNRMDPQTAKELQDLGMDMLLFCIEVAEYQLFHGRFFYIEQPDGASSWNTHAMTWLRDQAGVFLIRFDQCAAGLSVRDNLLSRTGTGVISNHGGIIAELAKLQCDHSHQHLPLQGGLPLLAQKFPPGLVQAFVNGMLSPTSLSSQTLATDFDLEDGVDAEIEESGVPSSGMPAPQTPGPVLKKTDGTISQHQKELLHRLHANLGHLPRPQLLMTLKAAGAKESILQYVQDQFECEQCVRQKRPIPHKQVTFPRTFSFNQYLGIDFFYISFMDKTHAFLNVICQGTNFQQVGMLTNYTGGSPSSRATWALFEELWIRPFGLPSVILSDQGSEFKELFERRLEQHGVLQVTSDGASPWQNGRCERHGSWVKQRLEDEIQSGQATVTSSKELEELTHMLVSFKNKYFHRGGFSPFQLVFGISPRLPADLLSDDQLQLPALQDLTCDPMNMDTAASEFARSQAIRQRARELCVKSTLKDKAQLGIRKYAHKERTWTPGQWVYCWRKFSGTGGGHMTRARWMGPGLVIQQSGHTVWVSMRSRLWKCSSDQLRPATYSESIGAELMDSEELEPILSMVKSKRATAVDVASEGPPPDEADMTQVGRDSVARPAVAPPNPLPAILEEDLGQEEEVERASAPQGSILRDLRPLPTSPAPPTPRLAGRRESTRTIEEPLVEPAPSSKSSDGTGSQATQSQRRVSAPPSVLGNESTRQLVRKRVAQLEAEQLERDALRFMRQMDREERARRRREENPFASIPASSDAPPDQTQSASEQGGENELVTDELLLQVSSKFLPCFYLKATRDTGHESFIAKPAKAKNAEFNMRDATPEERQGFREADINEWKSIVDLKAVRVLSSEESKAVMKQCPDRVISSRMVRRKKPTPGVGAFKYKSRWCIHGHQDPDTGLLEVFAPTPCTESITMFFQICVNEQLLACFLDVKNAFCQSKALKRSRGKIYARPCEGLPLSADLLIEIVAPVYGLDDAPLAWHQTLLEFFFSLGFERTLLEPCWLVKRDPHGRILAQVLIEVDDLNFGIVPEYLETLKNALEERFLFGKMEFNEADFAGRHIKVESHRVTMHQEKYILEKIFPLKLAKGKLSDKAALLQGEDFESYRSLLYKVNWVAHQTRPEAAGVVSLLASRLHQATVHDLTCLNKMASYLRGTAQQPLVLHKFDSKSMVFVAASDAGGIDGKPILDNTEDTVQGAWIILATSSMPSASHKVKASVLSWRSAKLRRRVASTLAGEALAFSQALGEVEWLQIMFRDVVFGDVSRTDWQVSISPFLAVLKKDCKLHERLEQCGVTDAKGLFDSLKKQSPTSRQDRRTSIEVAIIIEGMSRSSSALRWCPHPRMVADGLTKDDLGRSNGALEELLRTSKFALWDEEDELARRKENPSAKGRSRKASEAVRSQGYQLFVEVHDNRKWGELLKHACNC